MFTLLHIMNWAGGFYFIDSMHKTFANFNTEARTCSCAKNLRKYRQYTQELVVKISAKISKACRHEKYLKQSMLKSN